MAKAIDWSWIERQWKLDQLSNVQISKLHEDTWNVSVSEAAIRKRAKAQGWKKNLAGEVRREVESRLVRDGCEDRTSDLDVIQEAAERAVLVVREHRRDIARARDLVFSLAELAGVKLAAMKDRQKLKEEADEEENKLNPTDTIDPLTLQQLSGTATNIANALNKLIALERQAFSIDVKGGAPNANGTSLPDDETAEQIILAAALSVERKQQTA